MDEMIPSPLRAWESFYVIVGSSAGALTGLQFVVLTLITESGRIRGSADTMSAFASPNVVHFCAALLVSALLSMPWHGLPPAGIAVMLCGIGGFLYSIVVMRRAMSQRDYRPVLEDWIWHAALPMVAYAALWLGGLLLARSLGDALFLAGGSALLLVFIGIHNAWDTVMYVMLERDRERKALRPAAATATPSAPSRAAATPAPKPTPGADKRDEPRTPSPP